MKLYADVSKSTPMREPNPLEVRASQSDVMKAGQSVEVPVSRAAEICARARAKRAEREKVIREIVLTAVVVARRDPARLDELARVVAMAEEEGWPLLFAEREIMAVAHGGRLIV